MILSPLKGAWVAKKQDKIVVNRWLPGNAASGTLLSPGKVNNCMNNRVEAGEVNNSVNRVKVGKVNNSVNKVW